MKRMNGSRTGWRWVLFGALALGTGGCAGRGAARHLSAPLGFSGMVALGEGKYLVVHDTKGDAVDPRVSVLDASAAHAQRWWQVAVDWAGHEPSSDLESVCAVPGTSDEFLLCESNYWHGHYGRLFHVRFDRRRDSITILHVLALPHFEDDIEGCVCTTDAAGNLFVIVGERGGRQGRPAVLHWGWLELKRGELRFCGSKTIAAPEVVGAHANRRGCGDLYLDGQRRLWCVATEDAGDGGPFRSVIYRLATVDPDSADPVHLIENPTAEWICEGIKVEALGAPLTDDGGLTVGTDDEDYPGMFRPLFPVRSPTPHLEAGRVVELEKVDSIADTLSPRRTGALHFEAARRCVDDVVLVTDDPVLDAMRVLWDDLNLLVEPSGAASLAALPAGKAGIEPGARVGIVVPGANLDARPAIAQFEPK